MLVCLQTKSLFVLSIGVPQPTSVHAKLEQKISSEGYFRPESPWLPGSNKIRGNSPQRLDSTAVLVAMEEVSVSWTFNREKMVLNNINFEVTKVRTTVVHIIVIIVWYSLIRINFVSLTITGVSSAGSSWFCRSWEGGYILHM